MSDTPAPLRGARYTTHLTLGCAAFHKCLLCAQCRNFDKHSAACQRCEARKPEAYRTCGCTDKQIETTKALQEKFDRPLFPVEGMSLPDTTFKMVDDSAGRALDALIGEEFLGAGIGQVEHIHETTDEKIGDVIYGKGNW